MNVVNAKKRKRKNKKAQGDAVDDEEEKRSKITIMDLPPFARKEHLWRHKFMPTLVRFTAALDTPWAYDEEEEFERVLLAIWNTIFPDNPYTEEIRVVARALVSCIFTVLTYSSLMRYLGLSAPV